MSTYSNRLQPDLQYLLQHVVRFFHPRSSCTTMHISVDVQRITLNASCLTISGGRTEQLDIFCCVTGFTSDFLSFIVVERIRFFHWALHLFTIHVSMACCLHCMARWLAGADSWSTGRGFNTGFWVWPWASRSCTYTCHQAVYLIAANERWCFFWLGLQP